MNERETLKPLKEVLQAAFIGTLIGIGIILLIAFYGREIDEFFDTWFKMKR